MVVKFQLHNTGTAFSHGFLQVYHVHWHLTVKHSIVIGTMIAYIHSVDAVVIKQALNGLHSNKLTIAEMIHHWGTVDPKPQFAIELLTYYEENIYIL